MVHKVPVVERGVKLNGNRKLLLKILDESLRVHGLKEEDQVGATSILTPQAQERARDLISRAVGAAEKVWFFEAGMDSQLLIGDIAEMDDVGNRLLEEMTNDWIDALNSVGHDAEAMESFKIESTRILTMEVYIRLVVNALRQDSKLSPPKERKVWTDVIQTFITKINSDRYGLKFKDNFIQKIETIHVRWLPWIRAVVCQVNETELAKNTITSNLEYMKSLKLQVMRYLVVALQGRSGVKKLPYGSLANRQISNTLKKSFLRAISKHANKHGQLTKLNSENGVIISCDGDGKNLKEDISIVNLLDLNLLSKQEIDIQNAVISVCNDQNVINLIALLNWTKVIIGLIERIDRVIGLGSWVPILMNMMDFSQLDILMDNYEIVFNKLVDPTKDDYGINGTKLRNELGKYNIEVCGYDKSQVKKMKGLQSQELLDRIRDKLSDAFLGVMRFSTILKCNMVDGNIDQSPQKNNLIEAIESPAIQEKDTVMSGGEDTLFLPEKEVSLNRLHNLYDECTSSENGDSKSSDSEKKKNYATYKLPSFFKGKSNSIKSYERLSDQQYENELDKLKEKFESLEKTTEQVKEIFDRKF